MSRRIVIIEGFKEDAKNIFNYINKESPKNAKKFNQTSEEIQSGDFEP